MLKRGLIAVGVVLVAALATQAVLVVIDAGLPPVEDLARRAPRRTSLMKAREAQARRDGRAYRVDQRWVPYVRISPLLRHAVLIAEDDAFFSHGGLDWHEIGESARANLRRGRVLRGGSTITQQLAKNLFLGEERTLGRKLKEVVLALRLERALTKRRLFELYLNLIEWGDGIFGAEAAARRHFGVSAAELDARQSALLAAVIVNPRRYSPGRPTRRVERRMRMILSRMSRRGLIDPEQYRAALSVPAEPAGTSIGPADSVGSMPTPLAPPDSGRGSTAVSEMEDTSGAGIDSLPH